MGQRVCTACSSWFLLAAADPDYGGVAEGFVVWGITVAVVIVGLILFVFALPDLLGIFPPRKRKKKAGETASKNEAAGKDEAIRPALPRAKASVKNAVEDEGTAEKQAK